MNNNAINIFNTIKTPFASTRKMADTAISRATNGEYFDFSKIQFVSAAFADEFLRQSSERKMLNVDKNIVKMFEAVKKRSSS
ncbi:MAG: hypothetical protein CEN91_522 [Candidatus Berkelbacteria bacterium Licking1014_85]|uniref:Uncharacterized protein n=1 Tax=Candidatus Berkelbacteria bacterium Licking1014_85 TaxID=2017148 RepID=A0A554LH84_9BACT|nr:MAG: hypothetical protein CEN91_522 [Candidatus Berkelbacteria bacterium Licking1014_85]